MNPSKIKKTAKASKNKLTELKARLELRLAPLAPTARQPFSGAGAR